jgi:uncharacterized membrane protein (UPF0182 family)
MSPLAPVNREKQNILGWMCARCDGDKYGQLVLYRFPQGESVNGPSQAISLFNSEPSISKELSLLRQGGSNATFGNLLVIPIEKSLLYIAPLYVESTSTTRLPQLQRVAVAFGSNVAMGNTLDEALTKLFPGYGNREAETTPAPAAPAPSVSTVPAGSLPPVVRSLIERAATQYDSAQQRLKSGDFAGYGEATKALERTLNELRHAAGANDRQGR